jgi:hypothetical protein
MLDFLPPPVCTLGGLRARAVVVETDGEHVYLMQGMNGNETGRVFYAGKSDLNPWERAPPLREAPPRNGNLDYRHPDRDTAFISAVGRHRRAASRLSPLPDHVRARDAR